MKRDYLSWILFALAIVLVGFSIYHLSVSLSSDGDTGRHAGRYFPSGGLAVILILLISRRRRMRNGQK